MFATLKRIEAKVDQLIGLAHQVVDLLNHTGETIMADLTNLTAQVTANTNLEASAVQLIQGLAKQIAASSGDQAAVDALAAQLQSSATALAAAITANTPAAPAAPASPAPAS